MGRQAKKAAKAEKAAIAAAVEAEKAAVEAAAVEAAQEAAKAATVEAAMVEASMVEAAMKKAAVDTLQDMVSTWQKDMGELGFLKPFPTWWPTLYLRLTGYDIGKCVLGLNDPEI